MTSVTFSDLLAIYRHTQFTAGGNGTLTIASESIADLVNRVDTDDDVARDTGLTIMETGSGFAVGQVVRIQAKEPKYKIGLLVETFDSFLNAPKARWAEPQAYYIINDDIDKEITPIPPILHAYRKLLQVVNIFIDASSYFDVTRGEFIFFQQDKAVVPIAFHRKDLLGAAIGEMDRFIAQFADESQKEQKLAILSEAIFNIVRSQSMAGRFVYLLQNLDTVNDEVAKGYKLFASSFSYAKIRGELEGAKLDFIAKIHKTIFDIQGQILGVPIAAIVVASQLKKPTGCGVEVWSNFAIIFGAWIFVGLLVLAIVNQAVTLKMISEEVTRQKNKLSNEYSTVSGEFSDIFSGLSRRIVLHSLALILVGVISVLGAIVATAAYNAVNGPYVHCLVW